MSLSGETTERTLDVTALFNPVDCQSLGVIRTTLASMEAGEVLAITANRFQKREIESWSRKFRHRILSMEDTDGRVLLRLEKAGSR